MPSPLYQIEVARTVETVEALRAAWQDMPSRVEADIDFFLRFMEVHDDFVVRPHVIALRKEGRVVTILPGRLERRSPTIRLGYKEFALPAVSQLTFVGQLLGDDRRDAAAEVMKSIQGSLRRNEGDVVLFHQADSQEYLHEAFEKAGGILTRDYFKEIEENWKARIPNGYGAFLESRSRNTRRNLKRYSKRLSEAFPGRVQHKCFQDASSIQVIFKDCEAVAAKSYHRALNVGFFDNEKARRLFTLTADRGWLRSYILYIDGRASAFWNGFLYRGTFLAWDTAYDAELTEFRPGLYLLQKLVEDLCASGSVRELDFGIGSAQYKQDMCDTSRLRVSELLFAPTPKGVFMNAMRTPPLAVSYAAKWVLKRSGFFGKVRKMWRSRLTAAASTGGLTAVNPEGGEAKG
jgi:hypothetical protein